MCTENNYSSSTTLKRKTTQKKNLNTILVGKKKLHRSIPNKLLRDLPMPFFDFFPSVHGRGRTFPDKKKDGLSRPRNPGTGSRSAHIELNRAPTITHTVQQAHFSAVLNMGFPICRASSTAQRARDQGIPSHDRTLHVQKPEYVSASWSVVVGNVEYKKWKPYIEKGLPTQQSRSSPVKSA